MDCEVCVVGLGVSSLPLLKSGTDFRVVTSAAFGIWQKLSEAKENFDLVTTIESTNYSWWDYDSRPARRNRERGRWEGTEAIFHGLGGALGTILLRMADYDFPFYTARSYHEKLLQELTPELQARTVFAAVGRVEEADGKYQVFGSSGELLVSCRRLVHAVGFSPDQDILGNLRRIAETPGTQHFLIFGFSDTTNMYISRLVRAGHRVTIACRHFHVVDKIGCTHGNSGGPFDQYEPMQHWTGPNQGAPNVTGILVPLPIKGAKVGSPTWLAGKLTSYVASLVGLAEVLDLRSFDTEYQQMASGLVAEGKTDVPGGLGYLVKQWPVDEYVRFYSDERFREWMLRENVLLNDIYFFLQQGLVSLFHRDEVQHVAGKKYRLRGEEVEFDQVFHCQEAKHRTLDMPNICPHYSYAEHLFGMWNAFERIPRNKARPNLFFLGTTRPYTGAFGCVAEVNAMFVHRMITDHCFAQKISAQFPSYLHRQRVTHYVQASEPDKLHVHWAGMHMLRVSEVLGCDLSYAEARKLGLATEWMTGPINALRCRICGPYATEGAAAKYRRSCAKLGTNQMYLNMIYRTWGDRLVVASWLPTLLLAAGLGWRQLGPAERALAAAGLYFLAATPTAPSRLRGFLLMLAFDSLYHTRAWVMLLLNCLQLLLSILCFLCGSTFGVPLIFRLGVVTDLAFLVLGYLSFPRAFFGDMRCRSPHKQWLFSTYLKVNWAVPHSAAWMDAHYIALSFVQSAEDILECRKHCASDTKIIAKIENAPKPQVEGLRNFDAILREARRSKFLADGIMVARGRTRVLRIPP
ncbi:unnamed protein product [Effrenium voratum]|nr:unnamed protein product [Effrenium voratum]